jgi:hypothetical protein
MKVFIGTDKRQPVAYTVCRSSIERHAKKRVEIEPLNLKWLPITRQGLTEFTFSRYMVPWLCGYRGLALFMDADMIARADVNELEEITDPRMAVSVVQGKLRFEWPSLMLFRCDNLACVSLTPEYVGHEVTKPQTFEWCPKDRLGALPAEWNHCVGYDEPNPNAKVVHFTAGIPCFPETKDCEFADEWAAELKRACSSVSWQAIMGQSVHVPMVMAGGLKQRPAASAH